MDFLDPKKKRSRKIRLTIGHTLMVLLVFIATYILVFRAYGYDFDRKTGEVIQNGLVYIDSAPDGAKISINGEQHKSDTNTRVSLPEGKYTLELSKEGYRNWSRSFDLEGGEVLRYTYPVLFPSNLSRVEMRAFDSNIDFSTQSPNRRWILLNQKNNLTNMTLYDLEQRQNEVPTASDLSIPQNLLTPAEGDHTLKLTEWSTDNRHVLIRHNWTGGQEFVMLDIEDPAKSYNLNKTLNQNPSSVALFDKNFEKLFLYDASSKTLSRADIKSKAVEVYATDVISYKSHGDDTVLMSKTNGADKTKANIIMRQNDKDYEIREVPADENIPLDIARYDGQWYIAMGVQSEQKTYIYKNPLDLIGSKHEIKSAGAIVLRSAGPISQVSFSQNTRFIMANSGQHFNVYDAELDKRHSYKINQQFDPARLPVWMDGHRIVANSGGKVFVFDFDGINAQTLVDADPTAPIMFDRDYTEIYSLGASGGSPGKYGIYSTQLRLEADR